ncbi:MAG: hypothetical protein AAFV80_03570 [Bacteroidota bacterium]
MKRFGFHIALMLLMTWVGCNVPAEGPDTIPQTVEARPSLSELCSQFFTDKCAIDHNFVEVYANLFDPIRDSVTRVFEIGILRGASHLMWQAYFPNADIFGIDIEDKSDLEAKGIKTFVADQSNRADLQGFLDKYGTAFDIILDDGGHAMHHQQVSFGFLFEQVKPGGYYIIEDVHTSLPQFYPSKFFNVKEDESNTTLKMIETYFRTSAVVSEYMLPEEVEYLHRNIEKMELSYRTTPRHSMVCIIQKKK